MTIAGLRRVALALPLLAALVPPLVVAVVVARHGLNVPFWDQWGLAPFVAEVAAGRLRATSLWAQVNEHRIPLPRLVIAALARLSSWDVRWELWADLALAVATLGLLASLLVRTVRPLAPMLAPWLVLVASIVTFSLAQQTNWVWGSMMPTYMSVLAAVAAAWALERRAGGVAMLAALAGALSFGTGLLLLVLVPVFLVVVPDAARGRRFAALAALASAVLVALYWNGWQPRAEQPPPLAAPLTLLDYAGYALAWLGNAFAPRGPTAATEAGVLCLAAFVSATIYLWGASPPHRRLIGPWLFLATFAVGNACVTAYGRVAYGATTALLPRYLPTLSLFALSTIVVVALAVVQLWETNRAAAITATLLVAAALLVVVPAQRTAWSFGLVSIRGREAMTRLGGGCLRYPDWASDQCFALICWDPSVVRQFTPLLRRARIGPFATPEIEPPLTAYRAVTPARTAGLIEMARPCGPRGTDVCVSGWAADPERNAAATGVLIVVDGTVLTRTTAASPRPDLSATAGPLAARGGWLLGLHVPRPPAGSHVVEAHALLDGGRIAKLANRVRIGPAGGAMVDTAP